MRKCLPRPHPPTRPYAALARTRVRASPHPATQRRNLALWRWFARRPTICRLATRAAAVSLGLLGRRRGRFTRLPFGQRLDDRPGPPCLRRRHLLRTLRPQPASQMSKDTILTAIRRGLRRGPLLPGVQAALRQCLTDHPRQLIPARSHLPHPGQVALFIANVEKEFGTVTVVPDADAIRRRRRLPHRPEPPRRVRHGPPTQRCATSTGPPSRYSESAKAAPPQPISSASSTASPASPKPAQLCSPPPHHPQSAP